jgi:Protein of unknown function (DUF1207)
MRKTILLLFILTFIIEISAQENQEWFPSGLNIQPFAANFLEPRAGFNYLLAEKNIRLDIGTSSDIYKIENGNKTLSFGADLFTYTRLRSEKSFKFPVEAVDYLFGINSGYKITSENNEYGFRFRFAHISAHLVDGSFDHTNNQWMNDRSPFVYSREFFELFPFYSVNSFRVYSGFTYIFHVVPTDIGKEIYQAGFDNYFTNFSVKAFTPFISYDFKLQKIGKYAGSNILTGGIKFGKWNGKGFVVSISYYTGKSVQGEFYDINENYASLGFNMEL